MFRGLINFLERIQGKAPELPSPPNMIKWADIELIDNGASAELVIKNIPKPVLVQSCDFDTNSMDGAFDIGHASVYVMDKAFIEKWAHVGAIISFTVVDMGQPVGRLHQIVKEGSDDEGWYCIAQGLNNGYPDPWKIRRKEIIGLVLCWLWTENIPGKFLYAGGT